MLEKEVWTRWSIFHLVKSEKKSKLNTEEAEEKK